MLDGFFWAQLKSINSVAHAIVLRYDGRSERNVEDLAIAICAVNERQRGSSASKRRRITLKTYLILHTYVCGQFTFESSLFRQLPLIIVIIHTFVIIIESRLTMGQTKKKEIQISKTYSNVFQYWTLILQYPVKRLCTLAGSVADKVHVAYL